jgi:N-acetylglutamate synthase-like GNAT family acetyltransferase
MKIRRAKIKDAGLMSRLVKRTIVKINGPFYSQRQISAWKKSISAAGYRKRIRAGSRFILAAEEKGLMMGMGVLNAEKKMITGMYVSCGQIRRGIGRKIIRVLEKQAKKRKIKKLALNSSLSATEFYKKMGYRWIKKTAIKMGGIKIPCVLMNKKI